MKALRTLALTVGLFGLAVLTCAHHAVAESGGLVTGELVVINAASNQFRIVGHGGTYTAPAGTSVTALDGHTVRVELSSNGRVARVTDAPVAINPITHGWSTVRGALVVTDAMNRRFSMAGEDQTYVAPPGVDLDSYAGRIVEVRIDESGHVTDIHPVAAAPQGSYGAPVPSNSCSYRGQAYSAGAAVCQSGTQYRCDGSQWMSLGLPCQVSDAREVSEPPRSPRSCVVGDATVASGSGICREGTTLRCDDGAWINTRIACR